MAQQLIAINGNEEFPYTLQPTDIAEAMGLEAGIAPGGFNANGVIFANGLENNGVVTLTDSAWNNAVQFNNAVTNIILPTSNPPGAIIHFYSQELSTNPTGTFTISVVGSGQELYSSTLAAYSNNTSINMPYNGTLTVVSRGGGEIDIIGGTYFLTNNTGFNNFIGGMIFNPLNLCRSNANNKNLLKNSTWIYGPDVNWSYSTGLIYGTGITASGNYLYISGTASTSYTITSDYFIAPFNQSGNQYIFSGLIINQGKNSSGDNDTNSTHDITVTLNLYSSSKSLLTSTVLTTALAGSGWTFYESPLITIDSSNAGCNYGTIVISGETYDQDNVISLSQFKFEAIFNNGSPTLYSDEASTAIFGNNTFSGNGYQQLPSGLIMQWGGALNTGQSGSTPATATFPLAFPNECFQVLMTDTGTSALRYWTSNYTTTGFDFGAMETDASGTPTYVGSGDDTGRFIAFGW